MARGFPKHLDEVRGLVFEGKNAEAQAYGIKHLTTGPTSFRSYEPLGDLTMDFGDGKPFDAYRRELRLNDGVRNGELSTGRCHHHPRGVRFRSG